MYHGHAFKRTLRLKGAYNHLQLQMFILCLGWSSFDSFKK